MKAIIYLGALLLGLVAPCSAFAENWPTKEFRVIEENPDAITLFDVKKRKIRANLARYLQMDYEVLERDYENTQNAYDQQQLDQQNSPVISAEVVGEIEHWLKKVAHEYEAMGFKPPNYTDKDTSNNKEVFKVYVYHFSGGGPAGMLLGCKNNGPLYMKVDSKRNIGNGKLTGKAHQDLAHELFHAVQSSYEIFHEYGCPGDWLTEGTAEAVGIEMARKLQGEAPNNICQMGIRSYSERLYQTKARDSLCDLRRGYQTQSFWQFLAEYSTRKGFIATAKFIEPDYSYLHNFFATTHAMGSRSKEYAWLDKVLQQVKRGGKHQFGISLHTAYSRFVGTFASYWEKVRRKQYPPSSLLNTERKWIEGIFGTCVEVSVTDDALTHQEELPIGPVGSRCIKIKFDVQSESTIKLTFFSTLDAQGGGIESLAISTDGGTKIVRRHVAEQHPDKIGSFPAITAKPGSTQYFIVSNVAQKAGDTLGINPIIVIVPEIITTSMVKEEKAPDPSPKPSEKEERETAGKSRSWKGKVWQNKGRPCKRPFEASPCGPTTDIGLGLVPDTAHLAEILAQPSMSLERKFRLFDDVVQEGPESFVSEMMDDYMEIHQQDGGGVDIIIPQIQPGFTGTISNAHILVPKAIGAKGSYRALGPWVGSCRDGYWPSTGTVTIEEFSKYIFRGTFSAQLVDTSELESCQSVPVSKPDSGSFSITEIDWNLDIEPPKVDDNEIIDDIVDDINATIPGLVSDDLVENAKEQAKRKREEREQAKLEKSRNREADSVIEQCGCRCEMEVNFCKANPHATCCVSCEPIFKLCKGNTPSHSVPLTAEEQAKEDVEVQAMRQRYEIYVDSLAPPNEAIKHQMMGVFDQLETVNDKKLFMMAIPQ